MTLVAAYAKGDEKELGGAYEVTDQTRADQLLGASVELKRQLTVDSKVITVNLDGTVDEKFETLAACNRKTGILLTQDALDPYKRFTNLNGIKRTCVYPPEAQRQGGSRAVFLRNAKGGPVYAVAFDKELHGEWNKIKAGNEIRGHDSIPEETIEQWRGMGKSKGGRPSKGAVRMLDEPTGRLVEERSSLGAFRKDFRITTSVTHDDLVKAGKKGYLFARKTDGVKFRFVHAGNPLLPTSTSASLV